MSAVSSKSLNDAMLALDRLTGAINAMPENLGPFFRHLAAYRDTSNSLEESEDEGIEEQQSSKTLYFHEQAPKEIKYHLQNVSSLSDEKKVKLMNTFMELYLLSSFVTSSMVNTNIVVVPALVSTAGKHRAFDTYGIMKNIVKETLGSDDSERHIGTIVAVIVDGYDYFTAQSTKSRFSPWDFTIYHPNNREPPKHVVNLARKCFFQDSNCDAD